jgi:hypothetical protein
MVVVGLAACASLAMAQMKGTNSQSSAPASSGAGTTSDVAAFPAKPVAPKLAGGNETGSPRALGKVAGESSPLCFQSGLGWQTVPQGPSASGGHSVTKASAPGIAGAHPLGTSQGISGQCGSSPASSVTVEVLKPGTPVGSRSTMKPVSHSAVSLSQVAGSGDSADAVQAFGNHAYISPIKLHRMMRDVPDLETRIKLQELSSRVAGKAVHSSGRDQPGKQRKGMRRSSMTSTRDRKAGGGRGSRAGQKPPIKLISHE